MQLTSVLTGVILLGSALASPHFDYIKAKEYKKLAIDKTETEEIDNYMTEANITCPYKPEDKKNKDACKFISPGDDCPGSTPGQWRNINVRVVVPNTETYSKLAACQSEFLALADRPGAQRDCAYLLAHVFDQTQNEKAAWDQYHTQTGEICAWRVPDFMANMCIVVDESYDV